MPSIRIVNLGDIVDQNLSKALMGFATKINPKDPNSVVPALKEVLLSKETFATIEKFKLGAISEADFTNELIEKARQATGVQLSVQEFDEAWNQMNPSFEQFKDRLFQVVRENTSEQHIVLVSHTNPKDMIYLQGLLESNEVEHTVDSNGYLNSIAGMPLHLSFTAKKPKAELIAEIVEQYNPSSAKKPVFFSSSASKEHHDICYVRNIKGKEDPIFQLLHAPAFKEVEATLKNSQIPVLFWNIQDNQSFRDALQVEERFYLPTSKL